MALRLWPRLHLARRRWPRRREKRLDPTQLLRQRAPLSVAVPFIRIQAIAQVCAACRFVAPIGPLGCGPARFAGSWWPAPGGGASPRLVPFGRANAPSYLLLSEMVPRSLTHSARSLFSSDPLTREREQEELDHFGMAPLRQARASQPPPEAVRRRAQTKGAAAIGVLRFKRRWRAEMRQGQCTCLERGSILWPWPVCWW